MADDEKVWEAQDAFRNETLHWRVVPLSERKGAIAIRDMEPVFNPINLIAAPGCAPAPERMEFKGEDEARFYIQWRAMKAALEAIM